MPLPAPRPPTTVAWVSNTAPRVGSNKFRVQAWVVGSTFSDKYTPTVKSVLTLAGPVLNTCAQKTQGHWLLEGQLEGGEQVGQVHGSVH